MGVQQGVLPEFRAIPLLGGGRTERSRPKATVYTASTAGVRRRGSFEFHPAFVHVLAAAVALTALLVDIR